MTAMMLDTGSAEIRCLSVSLLSSVGSLLGDSMGNTEMFRSMAASRDGESPRQITSTSAKPTDEAGSSKTKYGDVME
ncbi:hypothetical protein WMY93_020702 [Mugilogobius chulae]|uniref:Uncharacterized protein n=1 Tax=Mugilogobius chulae TaxID=88201 RepID=A0AAW0NDH9_9GOBI